MEAITKSSQLLRSFGRVAAWVVSLAAAIYVLLSVIRVGMSFWLYQEVNDWVTRTLGLDSPLSIPLSIVLTAVIAAALPYLVWYVTLGRHTRIAVGLTVAFAVISSLLMVTLGQNVYFDRLNGRPLVFFALAPNGQVILSRSPGFDPTYGIQYQPITKEVAAKIAGQPRTFATVRGETDNPGRRWFRSAQFNLVLDQYSNTNIVLENIFTGLGGGLWIITKHCNESLETFTETDKSNWITYKDSNDRDPRKVVGDGFVITKDRASMKFNILANVALNPRQCRTSSYKIENNDGTLDDDAVLYVPKSGVRAAFRDIARDINYER